MTHTLQETNISQHWKRKIIDSKVPAGMGYVSSQKGSLKLKKQKDDWVAQPPTGSCFPDVTIFAGLKPKPGACKHVSKRYAPEI